MTSRNRSRTSTLILGMVWLAFVMGFGGTVSAQGQESKQVIKPTLTREQIASLVSRFDTVADSDTLYTLILPSPAARLALDKLGNVFVITQRGEVLRYDSLGKLQANYRELRYGQPAYIDVSDPYNLVLCYPQAARVTLLDNNLVSKGIIELPSVQNGQAGLQTSGSGGGGWVSGRNAVACRSADGNLWFWDDLAFRLVKVNSITGAVIQEGELLQATSSSKYEFSQPQRLVETEQHVYIALENGRVLEYDFFGAYRTSFWILRIEPGVFSPILKPGELQHIFQGQSLNGGLLISSGQCIALVYSSTYGLSLIASIRESTGLWALNGPYLAEIDSATGLKLRLVRRKM